MERGNESQSAQRTRYRSFETAQLMNCSRRHVVNLLNRLGDWARAHHSQEGTANLHSKESSDTRGPHV